MKKKLVLKFDGMHTEKKGYISFMFERYLKKIQLHMKDLILLSDYEGYVYIIHMFIWVFNKILEPWKYFFWGGGDFDQSWNMYYPW